ncbi:hypothetical protein [Streptomyces sp. NPDC005209]|uniref:hypothetical protein n=1 Tax=Streptomyces sp. NPDC005209 TaxID=3156715 RepID=UPI00339F7C22
MGAIGPVEAAGATAEAERAAESPQAFAPLPRRRGRTTLMIVTAAVLGVVTGACTGFLIQAGREPTALPPLSQPVVDQAKGEPEPLSAAQDRRVRTDGDLRKLLVPRPEGARDTKYVVDVDGWVDLPAYADSYKRPGNAFNNLVDDEIRRVAATSWRVGDAHDVEIHLVQFRQESKPAASEWAANGSYWAEHRGDARSWPVPGTGDGNGMAFVQDTPDRKAGYLPLYMAQAYAWRGDVCMEVEIYDSRPIPKAEIMELAERQLGRL